MNVDLLSAQRYSLAAVVKIVGQQDAEDVLQEAALRVLTTKARFKGRSSFNTWFWQIAVREALYYVRRRTRLTCDDRANVELTPYLRDVLPADAEPQDEQVDRLDRERRLYDAISRLSTRKRKLAALRWLAGETARGAEKAARHKAKQQLREMLCAGAQP